MQSILKNDQITDIEKAGLIAQIKQIDEVVIEPMSDFMRGMLLESGKTVDQVDEFFSEAALLDARNMVKDFFAINKKTAHEVSEDAFERLFLIQVGQFRSNYKKALVTGV
jgi:ABC-type proline/glycine betaine transport system ATPase subunit